MSNILFISPQPLFGGAAVANMSIAKMLQDDGNVDITSFGKFEIFHRKERMGINPITKEKMMIHASKLPKFRPSQTLKNKCNEK